MPETIAHGCGGTLAPPRPSPVELADAAVAALVDEAVTTPKPGLVDRRGTGSHADMDLALMTASARALHPMFARIATASAGRTADLVLRGELAAIGRAGEADMLAVTGGVNTHRGAIWALGLVLAAAAMEPDAGAHRWCEVAGEIARLPDPGAAPGDDGLSNGRRAMYRFGVTGARGEAAAGFPHARRALHVLRTGRGDPDRVRVAALLTAMAGLDDTCLLHRGGAGGLSLARRGAARVLALGGPGAPFGRLTLSVLDRSLRRRNLSPGGSADALATALLLQMLDPGAAAPPALRVDAIGSEEH